MSLLKNDYICNPLSESSKLYCMKTYPNEQPATRRQLAEFLGISERTFRRKVKDFGLYIPPGLLLYDTQKKILGKFKNPDD